MTNDSLHNYLRDLLATAALHSASPEEQRQVEEHVVGCDECRFEFDEYRRVAALLGSNAALAPEEVWERVSTEIAGPPPPMQLRRIRQRNPFVRIAAVAAGLALLASGAVAGLALSQSEVSTTELAERARSADGAEEVVLRGEGDVTASAVVLPDGQAYLYDSELPELAAGRTFQLWAMNNGVAVSAGIFDDGDVAFRVAENTEGIAITTEASGGAVAPTGTPIASAELT